MYFELYDYTHCGLFVCLYIHIVFTFFYAYNNKLNIKNNSNNFYSTYLIRIPLKKNMK